MSDIPVVSVFALSLVIHAAFSNVKSTQTMRIIRMLAKRSNSKNNNDDI